MRSGSNVSYRQILADVQRARMTANYFFIAINVFLLALGAYFQATADQFLQALTVVQKGSPPSGSSASILSLIYLIFFPILGVFVSTYWYVEQRALRIYERTIARALLKYERNNDVEDNESKPFYEIEWGLRGSERPSFLSSTLVQRMMILVFVYFHT